MTNSCRAEHFDFSQSLARPANADGDDIRLFADDSRSEALATFFTLRQQLSKRDGKANVALSDFVAPLSSGKADYIGGFVVTAGFVISEPAPYEVYMAALIGGWFLLGLPISRTTGVLLAFMLVFMTGGDDGALDRWR